VKAEDTYFIYPADKSVVTVSEITLVGKTVSDSNHSVSVNNSSGNSKKYTITPVESHFNLEVALGMGRNTINLSGASGTSDTIEVFLTHIDSDISYPDDFIRYYLHSETDLSSECVLCHPVNENNNPSYSIVNQQLTCITAECHSGFDEGKYLHGPFKTSSCVQCHNPHGSEQKNFLKQFGANLCFSCHVEAEHMVEESDYVHYPVLKGECTSCHDPHKSNLDYHLKRDTMIGLCSGCHGEVYSSHEVLHEPVASGDCNVCHFPHVSKYKGLLNESGNDLCFTCHTVRKDEFQKRNVHEPVAKDCKKCHDPHGSKTVNHLVGRKDEEGNYIPSEKPLQELCLSCHRKLDPDIVDQIENGSVQHDPVVNGKCTVCHTPHSTNYKKQLKAPLSEICYSCHQKMKELIIGSLYRHGPVIKNDCEQCHQPHGSDNHDLLRAPFSKKFSDEFNIKNFELCFSCHNADIVLHKDSKVTGFRNGTMNLHYFHVNRKKNGRNCKTCHDVHASDQEKHIREKVPFNRRFSIKIEYTKTDTGGGCVVGCHKSRKYDRINPVTGNK
jgi:predicted CXXCH cytochrome family protein